jgi:alginate O-acetyltransferase complex protein AlgI
LRRCPTLAKAWLGVASLFFYAWWNFNYVFILLVSTVANFYAAQWIASRPAGAERKWVTALVIAGNLCLLGYFKYTAFFTSVLHSIFGFPWTVTAVVLPLGISFYTFQKIAYIADIHAGQPPERNPINFLLFVCFFPQLIAGSIVHHREVLPQFSRTAGDRWNWTDLAVGLTLFGIGLFKKTALADPIAAYVNPIFDAAARDVPLTAAEAWFGALGYTFQLYFDFSGYSDMAIGLARLFGIRLPLNFASPYRSRSIIEFWRRWHMTLSRLLRDYVYFPLGGNRKGPARRYANIMAVMLLGGLWHGAGWTFIVWGGLHGVFLLVNHGWRALRKTTRLAHLPSGPIGTVLAYSLTFGAVVVAWVFFRASSLPAAVAMVRTMFGAGQLTAANAGWIRAAIVGDLAGGLTLLASAWMIVTFAPNSQTLLRSYEPAYNWKDNVAPRTWLDRTLRWQPSLAWGLFTAVCIAVSLLHFSMSANSSISISEPPTTARFILAAIGAALLLLACAGTLNWWVDPFDKLGNNQIGVYSSSERDAKPQMIVRYPHDGLILGTSRMTYVDPTMIGAHRFFNAAFSAATPEEILDFLRLFAVDQKLVVVGLDFMMFNESYLPLKPDTFKAVRSLQTSSKAMTWSDVRDLRDYLLSWNVTWSSIKALLQNWLDIYSPFLMPAGNRNARNQLAQNARISGPDDREAVEYWRTNTLRDFRYSQARLAALEQIKELLRQRRIPLIVLITPDNSSFIALIEELGLYPLYLKFRKDVREVFPDVFDFSESRWSDIDYRFKSDTGHFLPQAGAEMMAEVLSAHAGFERAHGAP